MAFLDETGLAELWRLIKAEDAKGAKVEAGSYVGTGASSLSVTFGSTPKLVVFFGGAIATVGHDTANSYNYTPYLAAMLYWGVTEIIYAGSLNSRVTVAYSGNTMTFTGSQYNQSGGTYRYIAIY